MQTPSIVLLERRRDEPPRVHVDHARERVNIHLEMLRYLLAVTAFIPKSVLTCIPSEHKANG
jgi:hypothetical protein